MRPSTRRTGGDRAMTTLLEVEDLSVQFNRKGVAPFTAVDNVSFSVAPGQTVGLVGESGCGKSVTSMAIMRLLPKRGTTITGTVQFEGTDLLSLPLDDMRERRGPRPRDDLPGPAVVAEPGGVHRDSGHRGARAAPRDEAVGRHARGPRSAGIGGYSGSQPAAQGVPASDVRRHAATCVDRDGTGLPAQVADRRRANHRTGRHHSGADPGVAQDAGRSSTARR